MTTKIYDLDDNIDFKEINLDNPTLIKNNSYFSKISKSKLKKNLYIQLPKCKTKKGIIKSKLKNYCELVFFSSDKKTIEFFEILEKFCIDEIYNNRELWLYDSTSITREDIEDLFLNTMKTYNHGKNILIKTIIKNHKITVYDENGKKLDIEDFNEDYYIIPLININGINFSSKNFSIELLLTQFMIVYPEDNFENDLLINNNIKKTIDISNNEKDNLENIDIDSKYENNIELNIESDSEELNSKAQSVKINDEVENLKLNNETQSLEINNEAENLELNNEAENLELNNEAENLEINNEAENLLLNDNNDENLLLNDNNDENYKNDDNINDNDDDDDDDDDNDESIQKTNFNYLINNELEQVDDINLNNDIKEKEEFKLKSRDDIYLEIYKKAKKNAKEIRKNAIKAFLEAKSIKTKYNLDSLVSSDSSEDDEELFD